MVKILIVEDNPQTAVLVKEILSTPDREIFVAGTAAEAEAVLDEGEFSLIILDLLLPDADGRIFLRQLRKRPQTAALSVLVLSEKVGPEPRSECLALGVDGYFEKPVDPKILSEAVTESLTRPAGGVEEGLHDGLTGTLNRAAFSEAFESHRSADQAPETGLTIAMLDLDHFRQINDVHGRDAGDEVLGNAAALISGTLREFDVLARWEEDKFAILFPTDDILEVVRVLEGAQKALGETAVLGQNESRTHITFSAGAVPVADGVSLEEAVTESERLLYLAKREGRKRIMSPEVPVTRETATILIAEDDQVTAVLVKHRLERDGFEIVHYLDGSSALEGAQNRHISFFLLDARMPGIDGFELIKRLRSMTEYVDTPILMLTSLGREEDIVRGFRLGANDYMTKPFSLIELMARINRLFRAHEQSTHGK
jgi:two-component system cell cycle response regulator